MADSIDKIVKIRFNYSELVNGWVKTAQAIDVAQGNVQALKADMKDLRKQLSDGVITQEKFDKAMESTRKELLENQQVVKALTAEQRQYEREIQNNIKTEKEQEGSLNALRASLNNLIAQYNRMSEAQRNAADGQRLTNQIKAQRDAIKEAEFAIGDYRSNVGNYENSIKSALGINNKWVNSLMDLKGTASQLGGVLKYLATPMGALLGVIGGGVAVFKLFRASINSTQTTGDELAREVAGWSNVWETFKRSVATVDFSLFIRNAREAMAAGRELQDVLDSMFERSNSTALLKASMSKENAELEETLRNTSLSYEERRKAGEQYLKNMKPIYEQEEESARRVRDAQLENLFALTKTREYASEEESKAAKEEFAENIKNYNLNENLIKQAQEYIKVQDSLEHVYDNVNNTATAKFAEKQKKRYEDIIKSTSSEVKHFADFARQYQLTNDEIVKSYVDAEVAYQNTKSAVYNDQKRIVNTMNSLNGSINKFSKETFNIDKALAAEVEKIWNDFYSNIDEQRRKSLEKQSSDVRKALNDLQKFLEDIETQTNKEISDEFISQYNQKQAEYRNRILNAQVTGGDEAAQSETVAILQEQLAEFDSYAAAYRAMGDSAIEIDNRRLEMLIRLHDEMNKGAQKEEQSMQKSFQAASDLAGALAGLAEEAGAGAPVVAVLGMAQAIASMGAALSKAFSSGNIWEGIAAAVTAIATITSVISQMKSLNSTASEEGAKYHYARGGLVTGPGTGTSDSISARLSNGEAVMTARAVVDWGPVLSMMNVSSGGNAIPTSHLPEGRAGGMREMEQMFERVLQRMPNPIVSVKDINTGQKRVKVQDDMARYEGRKK